MCRLTPLLIFILCCQTAFPQKFLFDETGKLLAPPPANIRNGQSITYCIQLSDSFRVAVKSYQQNLAEFYKLLNHTTTEEDKLINKLYGIYRLATVLHGLGGILDTLADHFDNQMTRVYDLNAVYSKRNTLKAYGGTPSLAEFFGGCNLDRNCREVYSLPIISQSEGIINQLLEIRQRRNLWRFILCTFNAKDSFKIFNVDLATHFYPVYTPVPSLDSALLPTVSFDYQYSVSDKPFVSSPKTVPKYYLLSLKATRTATDVKATNPFKKTAIEWSAKTSRYIDTAYARDWKEKCKLVLEQLKTPMKKVLPLYQLMLTDDEKLRHGYDSIFSGVLSLFEGINEKLKIFDTVWCPSSPIVKYLKSWIWFGNGAFSLNYIDTLYSPANTYYSKKIALRQKELDEQLAKIAELKKCSTCREKSFYTLMDLQEMERMINREKEKLKYKQSVIDKNNNAYSNLTNTDFIIHDLSYPIRKYKKQYIFNFNGAEGYNQVSNRDILPDDRDIYFGIYNSRKPASSVTIEEHQGVFNDSSVLQKELAPALSSLAAAYASLNPYGVALEAAFAGLNKQTTDIAAIHKENSDKRLTVYDTIRNDELNIQADEIRGKMWRLALLDKLLGDFLIDLPTGELKGTHATDTSYYTFAKPAFVKPAPFTDTFTIYQSKNKINEGYFSMGRQRTLQIGAGLVYNAQAPEQVSVDTSGNGFKVNGTQNLIQYVIGIKIFPFKSLDADNSIVPRYPLKRISIFAGFEIIHPLQNLYLSLGYDIIPGLQLTFGTQFAQRNYYKIQNNQIVDQTTVYKPYGPSYGINIDATILASVLKSIFSK